MRRQSIGLALCLASRSRSTAAVPAQPPVVRTADPIKRGLQAHAISRARSRSPTTSTPTRTSTPAPEKFTTTNMFVVTDDGVLVADGQGSVAETKGLVDAIAKVTPQPIKYVVDLLRSRRPHGRQRVVPRRRHLHHPPDVEGDPRHACGRSGARVEAAGRARCWCRRQAVDDAGRRSDRHPVPRPRAHRRRPRASSLPRQKILFLSEIYLNRVFPAMRSAYPSEWLKALDRAEAMKADIYIAGHGFTETGPVSKEEIPRLSQGARRGDRRSDAPPQRRRAGRRGDQAGELGRVRVVDAGLVAGADRDPESVRRAERAAQVTVADTDAPVKPDTRYDTRRRHTADLCRRRERRAADRRRRPPHAGRHLAHDRRAHRRASSSSSARTCSAPAPSSSAAPTTRCRASPPTSAAAAS